MSALFFFLSLPLFQSFCIPKESLVQVLLFCLRSLSKFGRYKVLLGQKPKLKSLWHPFLARPSDYFHERKLRSSTTFGRYKVLLGQKPQTISLWCNSAGVLVIISTFSGIFFFGKIGFYLENFGLYGSQIDFSGVIFGGSSCMLFISKQLL